MSENTQAMESKQVAVEEQQQEQQEQQEQRPVNLLTVDIDNENTALNVLVGFLGLAQKRGAFALNEAAKIHECVMAFQKNQ